LNTRLFSLDKLPQFENYTRRFNKPLSSNANEKLAYHYYIQQSIRNVLRRLNQQNRFDAIKRILHNNHLLPIPKDVMRMAFFSECEIKFFVIF
jgi:hypothetical protein